MKHWSKKPILLCSLTMILTLVGALASHADELVKLEKYPLTIESSCRDGQARLYNECGSQFKVLEDALASSEQNGKIVLVSYGAEWCIWCHVFEKFVSGEIDKFQYKIDGAGSFSLQEYPNDDQKWAKKLSNFFSEKFIIAHIENNYSPDGSLVLESLGADKQFDGGIPYIFAIKDGKFFAELPANKSEVRRDTDDWFRGYNRQQLLDQLQNLASNY